MMVNTRLMIDHLTLFWHFWDEMTFLCRSVIVTINKGEDEQELRIELEYGLDDRKFMLVCLLML